MSVANHSLIGALIAITIKQPALVLPLALLSHYLLDTLPHFGYANGGYGEALKHPFTYLEQVFSWSALIFLLFTLRGEGWLPYVAAAVAVSPDIMWPYRYFLFELHGKLPPGGRLTEFHRRLQWCERPWGVIVEIIFFGIFYGVLVGYLV